MRAMLLVWLGCLAAAGCGGADGASVNQHVSDLACDCAEGDAGRVQLGAMTLTHENPSDCNRFWVTLACSQDEADEVYHAA